MIQTTRSGQRSRMSFLNYQQSHLDLNKVESINKSQLVDLMNNFTISYLDKLKTLMTNVDSRLFKLNSKIIVCQSNLCTLEARIASVPGLSESKELKELKESQSVDLKDEPTDQPPLEDSRSDRPEDDRQALGRTQSNEPNEERKDENVSNDRGDDPELLKYKRMVAVGVPRDAVMLKMKAEGYDPSLLK